MSDDATALAAADESARSDFSSTDAADSPSSSCASGPKVTFTVTHQDVPTMELDVTVIEAE